MTRFLQKIGLGSVTSLVVLLAGTALAGLLGVLPLLSLPIVSFDQTGSTVIVNGALTMKMNASAFLLPGPVVAPIGPPTSQTDPAFDTLLSVVLDSSCNLVSGVSGDDFVLEGTVDPGDGVRDGVLLRGEVTDMGFLDGPATDTFDFRISLTGGLMADFYTDEDFGLQVTSEGSDFAADCSTGVVTTGGAKGTGGALPPVGMAEGCTPGYWKQKHHFDSWVDTGFDPNDTVLSVYGALDASVDGLALKNALKLKGGGLNALMRHSVAALLNAADPGVNSVFTVAEVIANTQLAVGSGNVETTKNAFEEANEAGCPLN